jgi:hypothetical protein
MAGKRNATQQMQQVKKDLIQSLEKALGVVTVACKSAGVDRSTFYRYYKEDDEFRAAVDGIGEVALDYADSQLHKQIKEGSTAATIFYLKTKGKRRGYIESQHHDHTTDGKPIQIPVISFEWPKNE